MDCVAALRRDFPMVPDNSTLSIGCDCHTPESSPLRSLTVLSRVGSFFGNRRPDWSGDEAGSCKVGFAPAEPLVTVAEYFS